MPLGGLISIAAIIPNIAWAFFPLSELPGPCKEGAAQPCRALVLVEQGARLGVFGVPFFYTFAPLHRIELTALVISLGALGVRRSISPLRAWCSMKPGSLRQPYSSHCRMFH
jgi:hypothetical protein